MERRLNWKSGTYRTLCNIRSSEMVIESTCVTFVEETIDSFTCELAAHDLGISRLLKAHVMWSADSKSIIHSFPLIMLARLLNLLAKFVTEESSTPFLLRSLSSCWYCHPSRNACAFLILESLDAWILLQLILDWHV